MAITSIGARGTGVSNATTAVVTVVPTATINVGRSLILTCSADNNGVGSTATGASSLHGTISDTSGNTWTKLAEYCHSPTGAIFDGVVISVWLCNVTTALTTSSTITMTMAQSTVEKALSLHEFSSTLGTLTKVGTPDYQVTVGGADFGSSSLSGFSSAERLWFRGMGKEANTANALTPTAGFTGITSLRSRNNAGAVACYGEFKIASSTGETSNPTLGVAGDTATAFVALIEGSGATAQRPVVFCCT